jgi:hypothetical protein
VRSHLRKPVFTMHCLVERHPTAILDSARLPLPKDRMEIILKSAWLRARNQAERDFLEDAFVKLAQFQDNVGKIPIDGYVPFNATAYETAMILRKYSNACCRTGHEIDTRKAAFAGFKSQMAAQKSPTLSLL